MLEQLFDEKRLELDQQLTMLQRRNTPAFRYVSLLQYGAVEPELLEVAQDLLEAFAPGSEDGQREYIDAAGVQAAAEQLLARYARRTPAFAGAETCLRADTGPGLMVSGRSLLISTSTSVPGARLDPLLQHEISVHVLTHINGSQQGLGIFGAGLAGYEGLQEGLGVFAEFIVGGLSVARLRLLAARVLVVHAMLDGADFVACHRLLQDEHGFSSRGAFNIVARIFRSGGLTRSTCAASGRCCDASPMACRWTRCGTARSPNTMYRWWKNWKHAACCAHRWRPPSSSTVPMPGHGWPVCAQGNRSLTC